jgi:hypothetical protein
MKRLLALRVLRMLCLLAAVPAGAVAAAEAAPGAAATPPSAQQPTEAAAQPAPGDGVLETTRNSVRSTVEWLARGLDSWFGDKPWEEGGAVTHGRLSFYGLKRESESPDMRLRFNARLRLPNVEERAYLFFGRENEQELIADTPGEFSRQERLRADRDADRSFFAGLGVAVRDSLDFRIGFRGGPKPFTQLRYRKRWPIFVKDQIEFRQTLFWALDERLGATTTVTLDHPLTETVSLRWLNSATISQRSRRYEWISVAGARKAFSGQRLWTLEAIVSGKEGADVTIGEYGLQTKWQQPVYRDFLLGEVIVGRFFPRKEAAVERGEIWAAGAGVILLF